MQLEGGKEMVASPQATQGEVVPTVECDTRQADANAVREEGDVRIANEGSYSSIAKRIRRCPRRWQQQPSAK